MLTADQRTLSTWEVSYGEAAVPGRTLLHYHRPACRSHQHAVPTVALRLDPSHKAGTRFALARRSRPMCYKTEHAELAGFRFCLLDHFVPVSQV